MRKGQRKRKRSLETSQVKTVNEINTKTKSLKKKRTESSRLLYSFRNAVNLLPAFIFSLINTQILLNCRLLFLNVANYNINMIKQ